MSLITTQQTAETLVHDLAHPVWTDASIIHLDRYWSNAMAAAARVAGVRILWTNEALHIRFDCRQAEPLMVSAEPRLDAKTVGLWERDVCEVFIAPDPGEPNHYFEFEAAPTGEWLDLEIHNTADGRLTNWDYDSGFTVASRIREDQVSIAMRIPWAAFGLVPQSGDQWRANFFRCVGAGVDRGYLAWQPTRTPKPNFHVPEAFGTLVFG